MDLLPWPSRRFPDRLKAGDLFLGYPVIYPIGRFLLDFLRPDASRVAGLNANQALAAGVADVAAGVLIWCQRASRSERSAKENALPSRSALAGGSEFIAAMEECAYVVLSARYPVFITVGT